jgi:hypothetical protein
MSNRPKRSYPTIIELSPIIRQLKERTKGKYGTHPYSVWYYKYQAIKIANGEAKLDDYKPSIYS